MPATIPSVGQNPGFWNSVSLAGIVYPGVCLVRGHKALKRHVKPVPGHDGAQYTSLGFEPANFSLSFVIADKPGEKIQWSALQQIAAAVIPSSGQKIQGIAVVHPALQLLGIKNLYLTSFGIPEQRSASEPDIFVCHVEMSQYSPLKVRNANTASHATPSVASYTQTSPAEVAGNLSVAPGPQAFTPGPGTPTNPGANSTPSNGAAGATYNPASGFDPAPAPLAAPSDSQSGPPQYNPNGGFG